MGVTEQGGPDSILHGHQDMLTGSGGSGCRQKVQTPMPEKQQDPGRTSVFDSFTSSVAAEDAQASFGRCVANSSFTAVTSAKPFRHPLVSSSRDDTIIWVFASARTTACYK